MFGFVNQSFGFVNAFTFLKYYLSVLICKLTKCKSVVLFCKPNESYFVL